MELSHKNSNIRIHGVKEVTNVNVVKLIQESVLNIISTHYYILQIKQQANYY